MPEIVLEDKLSPLDFTRHMGSLLLGCSRQGPATRSVQNTFLVAVSAAKNRTQNGIWRGASGLLQFGGSRGDPCAELSGGASQTHKTNIMKSHPSGHLSRKRETAAGWGPPGFPGTCWTPAETHSGTGEGIRQRSRRSGAPTGAGRGRRWGPALCAHLH